MAVDKKAIEEAAKKVREAIGAKKAPAKVAKKTAKKSDPGKLSSSALESFWQRIDSKMSDEDIEKWKAAGNIGVPVNGYVIDLSREPLVAVIFENGVEVGRIEEESGKVNPGVDLVKMFA